MTRIVCRLVERDGRGSYYDPDSGALRPLVMAPPGTMWFVPWWPASERGPDGRFLVVMTPAGTWCPDRDTEPRYTRTGTAPRVSITPAFVVKRADDEPYICAIQDGVMQEIDP